MLFSETIPVNSRPLLGNTMYISDSPFSLHNAYILPKVLQIFNWNHAQILPCDILEEDGHNSYFSIIKLRNGYFFNYKSPQQLFFNFKIPQQLFFNFKAPQRLFFNYKTLQQLFLVYQAKIHCLTNERRNFIDKCQNLSL